MGVAVTVADINSDGARATVAEIDSGGGRAWAVTLDVADSVAVDIAVAGRKRRSARSIISSISPVLAKGSPLRIPRTRTGPA